jgi:hypothetical protein
MNLSYQLTTGACIPRSTHKLLDEVKDIQIFTIFSVAIKLYTF